MLGAFTAYRPFALGNQMLIFRSFSIQAVAAGLLAGFVGFSSSFAVVVQGLKSAGASEIEASSGLMALSIAMGLGGIILSLRTRMPVSVAWSTPGAALLSSTGAIYGGFSGAVGAFLISALLLVLAGIWKPLGRAVAAIPMPLANAMLAGILLHMCLAPITAIVEKPILGLTIIAVWALTARIKRVYAVPAAFITTIVLIAATGSGAPIAASALLPAPVLITPVFSFSAFMSVGVPLFIVTMASQNIPGIAVLAINGFKPAPSPLFTVTGLLTLLSAPFGGHAVNLAAITAAMCAGPDAHADPSRRYWAGISSGAIYILFGLIAGGATALISFSPPILIEAVAGLALIGAFGASIHSALSDSNDREAAVITFLVAASGMSLFGIGGAFWGLLSGGAMMVIQRAGRVA